MSISAKNINSNMNYTHQTHLTREIKTVIQQPKQQTKDITQAFVHLSPQIKTNMPISDNTEQQTELAPELLINKLILEKLFGENLVENKHFNFNHSNLYSTFQPNTPPPIQNMPNTQTHITQTQTREQVLNFEINGSFQINNDNYQINYQFQLAEKKTATTDITLDATQLKDPIVIQYGDASINTLNGQVAQIDINTDHKKDALPMFSGDVGYLVHDKNHNGRADNGQELFGPETGNGFQELAQLDTNKNGFVDSDDLAFDQLYIWDQISPENKTWIKLTDTDIQGISLTTQATPFHFYDQADQIQAKMTHSSIAVTDQGKAYGVHQVDVKI